ncbi:MAG: hypothetical protein KC731_24420 [Myxococcales bacterium]|nr:hypothetical protein [Myxococcales bacterium]
MSDIDTTDTDDDTAPDSTDQRDQPPADYATLAERVRTWDAAKVAEVADAPIQRARRMPTGPDLERLQELLTPDEMRAHLKEVERDHRNHDRRVALREAARAEMQRRAEIESILAATSAEDTRRQLRRAIAVGGARAAADSPWATGERTDPDATPEGFELWSRAEQRKWAAERTSRRLRTAIGRRVLRGVSQ